MRISDWSSDVCSSDLTARRTCRYDRASAARTPRSAASPCQDGAAWSCPSPPRHCGGRRPAAIQNVRKTALDCFASLAMTSLFLRTAVPPPPPQLPNTPPQPPALPPADELPPPRHP